MHQDVKSVSLFLSPLLVLFPSSCQPQISKVSSKDDIRKQLLFWDSVAAKETENTEVFLLKSKN